MKKRMRKMTCLLLAVLLMATMVVPAAAQTGTGTSEAGYSYSWEVSHTDTKGSASIRTPGRPAEVTATSRNKVYDDLNNKVRYSETVTATGYASTTAVPNNIINIGTANNPTYVRGIVQVTYGTFQVAGETIGRDLTG